MHPVSPVSNQEITPPTLTWLTACLAGNLALLTPNDWFALEHDIVGGSVGGDNHWRPHIKTENCLWGPPPAACDVALEELREAWHKRT